MPFLMTLLELLGNAIAPTLASMGMMLLTERVLRRMSVITVRWLEGKAPNQSVKDALETIAQAWDLKP